MLLASEFCFTLEIVTVRHGEVAFDGGSIYFRPSYLRNCSLCCVGCCSRTGALSVSWHPRTSRYGGRVCLPRPRRPFSMSIRRLSGITWDVNRLLASLVTIHFTTCYTNRFASRPCSKFCVFEYATLTQLVGSRRRCLSSSPSTVPCSGSYFYERKPKCVYHPSHQFDSLEPAPAGHRRQSSFKQHPR